MKRDLRIIDLFLPNSIPGGLSHSEVLLATDLSEERLMHWYKRAVLSKEFQRDRGRGNRRRYSFEQAMKLALIRSLADIGMPISEAVEQSNTIEYFLTGELSAGTNIDSLRTPLEALRALAGGEPYVVESDVTKIGIRNAQVSVSLFTQKAEAVVLASAGITLQENRYSGTALVIPTAPAWKINDPLLSAMLKNERFAVIRAQPNMSGLDLQKVARALGVPYVTLFDYLLEAVKFLGRLVDVLEARKK